MKGGIKGKKRSAVFLSCLFIISLVMTMFLSVQAFDIAPFSDIQSGSWYTNAVSYCYDQGYVGGYEDHTFRPDRTLTRAEMAAIMSRMLGLSEKDSNTFSDVKEGSWYAEPVLRCVKAGIMAGYDRKTFGVNDPLTREQGALILANAFQIGKETGRTTFSDDAEISSWAIGSVKAMAGRGLIAGMGNNTFAPKSALTRAQMCQIIYAANGSPSNTEDKAEQKDEPEQNDEPEQRNETEEGFVDPAEAYSLLNAFRTESNVWYWNEDDQTKTVFNTGSGDALKPLERDSALEETAKLRAREIAEQFSHTRPDGSICFTAYPQGLMAVGENIAYGFSSASSVTEAWKETNERFAGQGHRRNMLSPAFNAVGIAGYIHDGTVYWVQSFGYKS